MENAPPLSRTIRARYLRLYIGFISDYCYLYHSAGRVGPRRRRQSTRYCPSRVVVIPDPSIDARSAPTLWLRISRIRSDSLSAGYDSLGRCRSLPSSTWAGSVQIRSVSSHRDVERPRRAAVPGLAARATAGCVLTSPGFPQRAVGPSPTTQAPQRSEERSESRTVERREGVRRVHRERFVRI
jgi:hypothetical protein